MRLSRVCASRASRYAPLCEVGAGTGYWGALLRAQGVDCVLYDAQPPVASDEANNTWHVESAHTKVVKADGVEVVRRHPGHTLLLIWPYIDEVAATGAEPAPTWDAMALNAFKGRFVAHVGELYEGVRRKSSRTNTSPAFCTALRDGWELERRVQLHNWAPQMVSELTVWRRKGS